MQGKSDCRTVSSEHTLDYNIRKSNGRMRRRACKWQDKPCVCFNSQANEVRLCLSSESRLCKVLDDQPISLFLDLGKSANFHLFFECGEDDRNNEKDVGRTVSLSCLLQRSPL